MPATLLRAFAATKYSVFHSRDAIDASATTITKFLCEMPTESLRRQSTVPAF